MEGRERVLRGKRYQHWETFPRVVGWNLMLYIHVEGVSKSFRTGRLEREMQMV
jgi:hypothetical protein